MRLFSQVLFLLSISCQAMAQCSALWIDGNGNWSNPGNWNGCVPNGTSDTATFTLNGESINQDIVAGVTLDSLDFIGLGGTLTLNDNPLNVNNINLTGAGTVSFENDLNSQTPTGALNVNISAPSSTIQLFSSLACGTFNLSGTLSSSSSSSFVVFGVANATDVNIFGSSLTINTPGSFTVSGNTDVSGGKLVLNENGTTYFTDSANITGGSLVVDSGGHFTATTSITQSGGLMYNYGTVQGPYFLSGTGVVLGNNGTFTGGTFTNGGQVDPTNHLNFGSYIQESSGTLIINIFNNSTYGSISATDVQLDGTLNLVGRNNFKVTAGTPFTIITTGPDGVSGTFNHLVNRVAPYIDPVVIYNSDSVIVEFFPNFPGLISAKDAIFSTQNQINFLLLRQMDRMVSRGCCCNYGWDAFVAPIGSVGYVDRREDFAAHNFYTAGAMAGMDYAAPFGGVGISLDYEHLFLNGKNRVGRVDVDRLHADLYGAFHVIDGLVFNMIGGLAYDWNDFRRNMKPGLTGISRSRPVAREVNALAGFEYAFCVSDYRIVPFVDYEYTYYHVQHARESAPDIFYALDFPKIDFDSSRTILGVRANGCFELIGIQFIPEVNAAWEYELGNRSKRIVPKQLPGASVATLLPITTHLKDRNIGMAGIDLEAQLSKSLSLDFSYEFEGNNHYINNFFYLGLNAQF